jgi:hypothetical protein
MLPSDGGYEQARRVWNTAVEKRPALIARCSWVVESFAPSSSRRRPATSSPSAKCAALGGRTLGAAMPFHWLPISSICCSSSAEGLGVVGAGVAGVDEDGSDRQASATASSPRTPIEIRRRVENRFRDRLRVPFDGTPWALPAMAIDAMEDFAAQTAQ